MTWFKMDDSMWGHPKWISIPRGARALWATAGSWCGRFDTEGHVPAHMLTTLGGRRADVDALLRVGLWHRAGDTCEHENCNPQGGWQRVVVPRLPRLQPDRRGFDEASTGFQRASAASEAT